MGNDRVPRVVIPRKPCRTKPRAIRIGTWNVRTMLRAGKLANIKREMIRIELNVLGLSEVRWKDGGDFESDGFRVCCAGGAERQRGVAIILDKEMAKRVLKVEMVSDRIILVKIQAEPVDLVIVQVYMPTSAHGDDEVEEMYERIDELMRKEKGKECLAIHVADLLPSTSPGIFDKSCLTHSLHEPFQSRMEKI